MQLIKKIDIFILKKYFKLFAGCFLICLFVFMMQVVWKQIEVLVGKGLGLDILAQFFFYMAITLVPVALPMSVLLTSLLTFGNMGEQLELTAMKAAGIPLLRIMRPLIISALLLTGVSFYFQNNISPKAQLEMSRMLFSMKNTSPTLEIPEGIFYNGIPNVNLFVERKDAKTGMLYNIIIYKIDQGIENAQIVVADSAKLESTGDKHFLRLTIFNGEQFENLQATNSNMLDRSHVPYDREVFQTKSFLIDFDTNFDLMNAEELHNLADTKSIDQLTHDADSMQLFYDSIGRANYLDLNLRYLSTGFLNKKDSLSALSLSKVVAVDSLLEGLSQEKRLQALQNANYQIEGMRTELEWRAPVSADGHWIIRKHHIKWHDKFASALACLFFFFIGAPLGAIIRKGGLGISTIVSVLIFIIYYIIGVSGMKMARDGAWSITYGMWISSLVMAPLGVFLTYKSNKDSVVFNFDFYRQIVLNFFGYRSKRSLSVKEVIIEEPNYDKLLKEMEGLSVELRGLKKSLRLNRLPSYVGMFFKPTQPNSLEPLLERMESIIEQLSNSHDRKIVHLLNAYPIPYRRAHAEPTGVRWINSILGALLPVGLLLWIRAFVFRRRLNREIKLIVAQNSKIIKLINHENIIT